MGQAGATCQCPNCSADVQLTEHHAQQPKNTPAGAAPIPGPQPPELFGPSHTAHDRRAYLKSLREHSCYPFARAFIHLVWALNVVVAGIGFISMLCATAIRASGMDIGTGLGGAGICLLWIALAYAFRETGSVVLDIADILADGRGR